MLNSELLNLSLGSMAATFYNYRFMIYFEHVFSSRTLQESV